MADEVTIDIRVLGSAEAVAATQSVQAAQQQLAAVTTQTSQQGAAAQQQASIAGMSHWQNFVQGIQTGWQQAAQQASGGAANLGAATTQGLTAALGPQSTAAHAAASGGSTASGGFWSGFTSAFSAAAHGSGGAGTAGAAGASAAVSTGMASMLRRGLAGIGIGIGVSEVFGFLKDSVKAYAESESAQLGFEDAFARFPKLADTNIDKIRELAKAREMLTRFDAEATETSFAQLSVLGLTGTQIAGLIPLVQDYAAKSGKTLEAATKDVSNAFLGQTTALRSVGITFDATGSAGYDYTNMVTRLNTAVGGFAEKDGPSAESALERLSNKWTNLKEVVGEQVSPVFVTVFGFLADNASWLGPLVIGIGALAVAWGVMTAAVALSTVVMTANPLFLVAAAIGGIIAAMLLLKDHWGQIWDWIADKVTWVWDHSIGWIVKAIIKAGEFIGSLFSSDATPVAPTKAGATVGNTAAIDPSMYGAANGAVLPGYAPGRDSIHALLSPGEGVLVPEVTRALGADTIHSWNNWGVQQRFAFGGIAGESPSYTKTPLEQALMKASWQSVFLNDGAAMNPSASLSGAAPVAPGAVPQGDPVERWRALATQALQMTGQYSESNLNSMMTRLRDESSGNPNAINNWDRNAKNGTPSQGLMQVIQPTFDTYAQPGYDKNLLDPLSNMLASINYATATYGSLDAAYNRKNADGSVAGYDSGGWLPPGGIAVSGLDKPEAVLTPDQWDTMRSAADRPSGGSTITIQPGAFVISGVRDTADVIAVLEREFPRIVNSYDRDRNTKRL